ncbi:E3 ubiquitin-protein ligase TRIM56-like [Mercenaria mercenaria]|uniref:E3 ubiquitin-protein ligase TRIM56-like n=1 Tax=Mercenaria mercenaria TaxID=6596 RepID=UPI00234F85C6|nr:E3 ubiquitin-protein ligase TRIM56-like [Mercenaria mercenaria]
MTQNSEKKNVCGICLSHFKEPKILPCFHTFCMKCLEDNVRITAQRNDFPCPTCRTSVPIPTGGVKCLQTNFYVSSNDRVSCDFDCEACGTSRAASHKCKQCDQHFCNGCSKIHLRMASSREHDIQTVSLMKNKQTRLDGKFISCERHPSEDTTMVCKDCDVFVCRVCQTTLHKEHSCNAISKEVSERRRQLRELIDVSENKLKEIENDIRVVRRQSESKHTFFNDRITSLRKENCSLVSNIIKKFNSFEEEIKQLNEEQFLLSVETTENQKLKTENFKQTINNLKEAIKADEDINFLRDFESNVDELNEIKMTLTSVIPGHKLMEKVERCTSWLKRLNSNI